MPEVTIDEFDESRQLCADGNCLGVVVDGKCNVCGLAASGEPTPGSAAAEMVGEGGHVESGAADSTGADGAFDDDRQLCPDGACTGLLGADGKCKECGRSAAS